MFAQRSVRLCVTGVVVAGLVANARGFHPIENRPLIDLLFEIDETALKSTAYLPVSVLMADVFKCEQYAAFVDRATNQPAESGRAIIRYFVEQHPVTVDKIAVQPLLEGFSIIEVPANIIIDRTTLKDDDYRQIAACEIRLRYPLKSLPRQISIVWTRAQDPPPPSADWRSSAYLAPQESEVSGTVVYGDKMKIITFTPTEPEYVWHGPGQVQIAAASQFHCHGHKGVYAPLIRGQRRSSGRRTRASTAPSTTWMQTLCMIRWPRGMGIGRSSAPSTSSRCASSRHSAPIQASCG
ncbi:MAG: hypothetical protein KKB50_15515 [Planctomycetes bacterium]|nr:hypothetical protein [Planctomycetota bacterium]